jgi:hypothetical protein
MEYKEKLDSLKNKGKEKLEEAKNYDYKAKMDDVKQTGQEGLQKLKSKKVKWIAISAVAVILILFIAVGISKVVGKLSLSPESAVKNMFHTYQSVEMIAEQMGTQPTEETKILQPILDNLKYKIMSTAQEDEENAIVTVEITAMDMSEVLKEVMTGMIDKKLTSSNSAASEDELMQGLLLESMQKKHGTVTNTVEISVAKEGWRWKAQADEVFIDAVLGGFYSAMEKLN